jgi:pimeloyl-ACP methyl ester carboxylesterase
MLETMKILLPVLIIGALGLYFLQDTMIFFPQAIPDHNRAQFTDQRFEIEHEGKRLQGWYVPGRVSRTRPLVVYYGGNAEEVSGNLWDLERLSGGAYLFMNYRGYGDSEGKPSQKAICRDALYILDTLAAQEKIPLDHIVLMGRSLGSGVAVHVAAHRPVRGVILVTPFDSLLNVARHHYPYLPVRLLLRHPFDSASLAPSVKMPALILMGGRDDIIPNPLSTALAQAWGGPVQTVVIEDYGHNDIQLDEGYWKIVNAFLSEEGKFPAPNTTISTTNEVPAP